MIVLGSEEQLKLLENILELLRQDHVLESQNQHQSVSTEVLVNEMLDSFVGQAKQKNIRLKKEVNYNGTIEVKPELFRQVMKNLMSNAIKFSYPDSEVKVSVSRNDAKTLIEIVDTGMGFESHIGERLFDRFTKNGRTGTAGEASTGIGLYLSRKIVKRHKGDLYAVSLGPDKGSKFTISLFQ